MASVRANCPTCGDVELTTHDLTVQMCADTAQAAYTFQCGGCRLAVSTFADEKVVALLLSAGVHMNVWSLPAELRETKSGAALTWDDALAFHDLLETSDWFDRVLRPAGTVAEAPRS